MPLANKKKPEPLPPCPEIFPAGSDLWRAFQVCKVLESKEQWVLFQVYEAPEPTEQLVLSESDLAHTRSESILLELTPACAARVLGFALLYSPSERGRDTLAAEILECNDSKNNHELLGGLAHLYVYGLIRVCASSIISYVPSVVPLTFRSL